MKQLCSKGYFFDPAVEECLSCQVICRPPWGGDLEKLCQEKCGTIVATTTMATKQPIPKTVTDQSKINQENEIILSIPLAAIIILVSISTILLFGLIIYCILTLQKRSRYYKKQKKVQRDKMHNKERPQKNSKEMNNGVKDIYWSRSTLPNLYTQGNKSIAVESDHSLKNNPTSNAVVEIEMHALDRVNSVINSRSSAATLAHAIRDSFHSLASLLSTSSKHKSSLIRNSLPEGTPYDAASPLSNPGRHDKECPTTSGRLGSQSPAKSLCNPNSIHENQPDIDSKRSSFSRNVATQNDICESNVDENEISSICSPNRSTEFHISSNNVSATQAQDGNHFDGNDFEPEQLNSSKPGLISSNPGEGDEETHHNLYIDIPQENEGFLPANYEIMERSYSNDSGAGSIVDPEFQQRSGFHDLHAENNPIYQQLQNLSWVMGYHSQGRSISVYANLDQLNQEQLHRQLVEVTRQPREKFKMRQNTIN